MNINNMYKLIICTKDTKKDFVILYNCVVQGFADARLLLTLYDYI